MDDKSLELGLVYPPRSEWEILAYDPDQLVAGFMDYERDEPEPGPNRHPAYRWSWRTRARDCQQDDDGFDAMRRAAVRIKKSGLLDGNAAARLDSYRASIMLWQHGTEL